MNTVKRALSAEPAGSVISLWRLFYLYALIGLTGFGPTLAAETQKRLVQNQPWLEQRDFVNGLSLAQLLPGATFVNLTVYIGYKLRGMAGAVTAFLALLLMPFTVMLMLSHIYFTYHSIETVGMLFRGGAVVVVGVITHSVIEVGRVTARDRIAVAVALAAAGLMSFSQSPFVALLVAALSGLLIDGRFPQRQDGAMSEPGNRDHHNTVSVISLWPAACLGGIFTVLWLVAPIPPVLTKLWLVFCRMGAVLFGGGLSMIPFIQQEVVVVNGWLSLDEFTVGIALSQMTPGPVLIIATFIGYKVAAISGALAATLGMFAPSLILVMGTAEVHERIRNNRRVQAALKGIAAAFTGMMTIAVIDLARHTLTDLLAVSMALLAFMALRFARLGTITVIVFGTLLFCLLSALRSMG
ncbi:chromate efflux transporter [Sporomusa aerivorans]|uniref:chromate efflux transporter n=1 Tax=Sporomusa aerivorans TaxID=204936 RepID=UPI003529FC2B